MRVVSHTTAVRPEGCWKLGTRNGVEDDGVLVLDGARLLEEVAR
jgi:hypothetical protein